MDPRTKRIRSYSRAALIGIAVGTILIGVFAYLIRIPELESVASSDIITEHDEQYSRSAYEAGRKQAERDLQQGILVIESYGLPGPWTAEYESLLAERYHIQLKFIAGCMVGPRESGHAKGYNEVMLREIDKRFGENLLEKVESEIIGKHESQLSERPPNQRLQRPANAAR